MDIKKLYTKYFITNSNEYIQGFDEKYKFDPNNPSSSDYPEPIMEQITLLRIVPNEKGLPEILVYIPLGGIPYCCIRNFVISGKKSQRFVFGFSFNNVRFLNLMDTNGKIIEMFVEA